MTKKRLLFLCLSIMTLWFLCHATLLFYSGESLNMSMADAGVLSLLLAIGMWISGIILLYYQPLQQNISGILSGNAILTLCIYLIYRYIAGEWLHETPILENFGSLIFITIFLLLSLFAYASLVWSNEKNRQAEELKRLELETLSREAELAGIRFQLQPHFLFNSLNSVSALISHQPEEARRMLQLLSDFLRGTIRKDPGSLIKLEEELEHLRWFIEIEQVRFADRLQVKIEANENTADWPVPSLILLPLVENAIKHGLSEISGSVDIQLQIVQEAETLRISLINPVSSESKKPGTGYGLESVKRRLFLLYRRPDLVEIDRNAHTFTITIRIPTER